MYGSCRDSCISSELADWGGGVCWFVAVGGWVVEMTKKKKGMDLALMVVVL